MKFYSKTDKGRVRKNNEDFIYASQGNGGYFAVVADGMGGHKAGEVASRLVVDTIKEALENKSPEQITEDVLSDALVLANKYVWNESHADQQKEGMGSTATAAVFNDTSVLICHVGDSRGYLFRDGTLSQITKDHSYVQMLVDSGRITKEEALDHPAKNIITRAVGIDESVDVDIYTLQIKHGDTVLLCSDGLNVTVSDNEIENILSSGISHAADALVDAALNNGGSDNISVVLAYMDGDSV